MAAFFFRGMLIGLLFGVPAGVVGAMTVQRTWNYGMKAGLLTGLGSSVADCIYACIGAFGLTVISEFLSYFGISGKTNFLRGMWLVVGVFLGTYLWWGALSVAVNIMKSKQKKDNFLMMNRILGVILCLFGLVVFIRMVLS